MRFIYSFWSVIRFSCQLAAVFCHLPASLSVPLFRVAMATGLLLSLSPLSWGQENLYGVIEYQDTQYHVGAGDVIGVQVYHQPDFSQTEILVRDDGNASFSGVGELQVSGKTVTEIQKLLAERIGELVIEPIVTVTITQTKPGTVYLTGAVKHPGMYQLTTQSSKSLSANQPIARVDFRISNILANSGGVTMNADLSNIEVKRAVTGEVKRVDLWKVLKEGSATEDIRVQSGDGIHVPTLSQATISDADYELLLKSPYGPGSFPVRVIGEVGTPGVYELEGGSPYLNSVIAKAGGYKPGAHKSSIAIRRFEAGEKVTTMYVSPQEVDTLLKPNDIVYIPEQGLYKTSRFFEAVARVFSPFTSGIFAFRAF